LEPVTVTRKFARNDYEPPPILPATTSDVHSSNQYEIIDATGVGLYQSVDVLPDNEQLYEDPGHVKEKIYGWLKQKNICRLKKNYIRYFNALKLI